MSFGLKTVVVAGLALAAGFAGAASAAPAEELQAAITTSDDGAHVEDVRLVCPPYRPCFFVPGFDRPYGFYRPYGYYRPYYRPYGFGGYGYGYRHFY